MVVATTLQGQVAGIDVVGTGLLLTLTFSATSATGANGFSFDAASREVQICPTPTGACSRRTNPSLDRKDDSGRRHQILRPYQLLRSKIVS